LVFQYVEKQQVSAQGHKSTPVDTRVEFSARGANGPIAPGDSRVYVSLQEPTRKMFVAQAPDSLKDIWVSVQTAKGEVCRIPRREVDPFFRLGGGETRTTKPT
jgi:hypothetical protein